MKTIVGFKAFVAEFGGSIPTPGVPKDITVLEREGGLEVRPISKAVVIRVDDDYLLLTPEAAQKVMESLRVAGGRFQKMELCDAIVAYQAAADKDAEKKEQYAKLVTDRFGEGSVWTPMPKLVRAGFGLMKPIVGTAPIENIERCSERTEAFEVAYAAGLKDTAPSNPSEFFEWERGFCREQSTNGNGGVPHVKGLRLVTRRFGKFGSYGAYVLESDVDIFTSIASKNRNARGEEYEVSLNSSDAYLGLLRYKMFFGPKEAEYLAEKEREGQQKRQAATCTLAEYLGQAKVDELQKRIGQRDKKGWKRDGKNARRDR